MKKLNTKNNEKKKQKRNNTILGIILVIIMFFSTVGYGFINSSRGEEDTTINYNGISFTNYNNYWVTKIGNFQFRFLNNPLETEVVDAEVRYLNSYSGKPLYIISENYLAESEVVANLEQIAQRIQRACLTKDSCGGDYPVKSCEQDNIIIIQENSEKNINQNGTCVFIRAPEEELTKLTDSFLLKILGISENEE